MTANQIAAAGVRESERHNAEYEKETNRHNEAQEQIERERNQIQDQWNQESLRLTEWYNQAYIEWLNADTERKAELEKEMNEIKRQQANADERYKEEMARLQRWDVINQGEYRDRMAQVSEYNAQLQAKRDYYEQQKTEAYITDLEERRKMYERELDDKLTNIEHNYELGLINAEQRKKEIELAQHEFELKQKQWNEAYEAQEKAKTNLIKQQQIESGMNTATKAVNAAANLVDSILPF